MVGILKRFRAAFLLLLLLVSSSATQIFSFTDVTINQKKIPGQVTVRAKVYPMGPEISIKAKPLTDNIHESSDGTFEVPLSQEAKWRITITINNNLQSTVNNLVLTDNIDKTFLAVITGKSNDSKVIKELDKNRDTNITWSIDTLKAGAEVQLEFEVATQNNADGKQGFTKNGRYTLIPKAQVVYQIDGKNYDRSSDALYVHAVTENEWKQQEQLRKNTPSLKTVDAKLLGDATVNCIDSKPSSNDFAFTEEFKPISDTIETYKFGKLIGFQVPEDTKVEWMLTLKVKNTHHYKSFQSLRVTEILSSELMVASDTIKATIGKANVRKQDDHYTIKWDLKLNAKQEASLTMRVYTGQKADGRQYYLGPTSLFFPNYLNDGATLSWSEKCILKNLCKVPVWVKSYTGASISATRLDWEVRKPGTFAAGPITINVQSNRPVTLTFSGFDDLANADRQKIPTYYGFGTEPEQISEWIRANDFNQTMMLSANKCGQSTHLMLWSQIEVDRKTKACEYENVGKLVIAVKESCCYLDQKTMPSLTEFSKGVKIESLSLKEQ